MCLEHLIATLTTTLSYPGNEVSTEKAGKTEDDSPEIMPGPGPEIFAQLLSLGSHRSTCPPHKDLH